MNLLNFASCVHEAVLLLASFPWYWLLLTIGFIALVESLMFIPYLGFITKLAAASLVSAQILVMFSVAAAGQSPQIGSLLNIFSLPLSSMMVLVATAIIPFFAGLVYLVWQGGSLTAIQFFFGDLRKTKPPATQQFLVFKYIMTLFAVPLTFVAFGVVLQGLSGWSALQRGLVLGLQNWQGLLMLLLMGVIFELLMAKIMVLLPRKALIASTAVLLVSFVAFQFALSFTMSAWAYGSPVAL